MQNQNEYIKEVHNEVGRLVDERPCFESDKEAGIYASALLAFAIGTFLDTWGPVCLLEALNSATAGIKLRAN